MAQLKSIWARHKGPLPPTLQEKTTRSTRNLQLHMALSSLVNQLPNTNYQLPEENKKDEQSNSD